MLTEDVKKYMESSVLCWLATTDKDNFPNVSPKEVFLYQDEHSLLIANIASPKTIANLLVNPKVCVSFVNIFIQKGYKLKGIANIIEKKHPKYKQQLALLTQRYSDAFPILSIIEIHVTQVESIKAPSYFLFPDITEDAQIKNAVATYQSLIK